MPNISIFSDEWRDCLRAHYTYVIRMDDKITERTLRGVMIDAGFSETELKEIYVLATAHVDDVGVDFVPDMEILNAEASSAPFAEPPAETFVLPAIAMPQEAIEAALVEENLAMDEAAIVEATTAAEIDEDQMDERELEDESEVNAEADPEANTETDNEPLPPTDPDATQLSLF